MIIIDERGGPLPDGHPFKGMPNIFGAKRPASPAGASQQHPALSPDGDQVQPEEQKSGT